ncbi:MAG: CHAD domain-containing protein [Pseudonocardia sp.]
MTRTSRALTTWKAYRGPAAIGLPSLVGLPGVHVDQAEPERVLETERYDTTDQRLAAARIVLTAERGDGPARWQLQLPDGDGVETLRVPANGATVAPEDFTVLLRGATRGCEVRPVGRIRTVRTTTRLLGAEDRILALVVHDHVTVATQGRSTTVESWTEAELRRAEGSTKLMAAVQERLIESGVAPVDAPGSSALAELDRLLGVSMAKRRRVGKPGSAGVVLVDYLAAHVEKLASEDLRVRRNEPDAVHQLRVNSRRLRSALQAYRPLLDRERTDPLVDGLRMLGRQLAPARDAEVLHERISTGLAELDPTLLLGPVQAQVTRHFARVESEARAAVLAELDSDRYVALRTALDGLLDRPPLIKRAGRPARKELPKIVAKSARSLKRAVTAATDPDDPGRDEAVHTARKSAKRLRYATDVARPAVGKPAKWFAKGLKGLQTALGEHQDTVVSRGVLRSLGAQSHSAGENGFSFGVLHGRDAASALATEDRLPELWKAAWRPELRKWLS